MTKPSRQISISDHLDRIRSKDLGKGTFFTYSGDNLVSSEPGTCSVPHWLTKQRSGLGLKKNELWPADWTVVVAVWNGNSVHLLGLTLPLWFVDLALHFLLIYLIDFNCYISYVIKLVKSAIYPGIKINAYSLLEGGIWKNINFFLPQSRRLMSRSRSHNKSVLEWNLATLSCWIEDTL